MNAPCHDCGAETLPTDLSVLTAGWSAEWYVIHDELWRQAGMSPDGGCLCIGCLETRLGRMLVSADFGDVPINDPEQEPTLRYAWTLRSTRLQDRLTTSSRAVV